MLAEGTAGEMWPHSTSYLNSIWHVASRNGAVAMKEEVKELP